MGKGRKMTATVSTRTFNLWGLIWHMEDWQIFDRICIARIVIFDGYSRLPTLNGESMQAKEIM